MQPRKRLSWLVVHDQITSPPFPNLIKRHPHTPTYTHAHTPTCTHARTHTPTCTHWLTRTRMHTHTHTHLHTRTHLRTHTLTYVHAHTRSWVTVPPSWSETNYRPSATIKDRLLSRLSVWGRTFVTHPPPTPPEQRALSTQGTGGDQITRIGMGLSCRWN